MIFNTILGFLTTKPSLPAVFERHDVLGRKKRLANYMLERLRHLAEKRPRDGYGLLYSKIAVAVREIRLDPLGQLSLFVWSRKPL